MIPTAPLNPGAASPLYLQLQRTLRSLIQANEWNPGMRLPAVPDLALRFKVHRLTVLKALAGLKRTGWVQTVTGRGSFVSDYLPEAPALLDPDIFPFQGSSLRVREDELGPWLGDTLEAAQNRSLVSFSAAFPPTDLLPGDALRRLYTRTMKELDAEAWVYAAPAGHPSYLSGVAGWLRDEGEPVPPGWGIRSIPGSQAGLALVLESLTIPGDRVLVESPCYVGALALIRTLGREAVPVPVDRNGLNPDRLASLLQKGDAKFLFTVPTFHNPTGMTLSRARRERILALTRAHGVTVVEDDTYGDLRFIGGRTPSFRSLPGAEHVIHLGSFSKSVAAGLRLGYIIAPDAVLRRLALVQEVHTIALPTLSQAVMGHFLDSGGFRRHLVRIRKALRERRDAMLEAIQASFPRDAEVTEPKGGMHLWVVLPEDVSALDLHREAISHGLGFAPGPLFFPDGRGTNCLRLNFSTHAPSVTREAIERLGGLIHARPGVSTPKELP
ncbi:PLP-dependent aminotransferase family protein [Geothrix sp. 21YS21S-2]|uniref:aminotransferase-like domain-containing protein n=1 Tax=Geothrix sp. 21YS21S-2 TaxID=3068893 RepID=UPI0027B9AD58|nr:PLP-dependent aminotransferase family protein [Geothrix sp. 21YS21S-2]